LNDFYKDALLKDFHKTINPFMSYFVCAVPVCPVRAEASHRSEQVSQLLFGEACELLEASGDFLRIKCRYDDYEGWCQGNQLREITEEVYKIVGTKLAAEWVNEIIFNRKKMFVPFASQLDFLEKDRGFNNINEVVYNGISVVSTSQSFSEETLKKIAETYVNTAYQWGGRSVFGVDCSGFTQVVFKCMNIRLLRDASQQATQGDAIGFLMEAKPGDLAFFDNNEGKITHVGILLNANTIIHASAKVRIDTIDNFGIVNGETGKRTHTLRVIKRIVQ
jgi:cell wall-associated NlpC family hydrolase